MTGSPARLVLTAGDPAGIGPELCLAIAGDDWPAAIAVVTDPDLLQQHNKKSGLAIGIRILESVDQLRPHRAGELQVLPISFPNAVQPGLPDAGNGASVLAGLRMAAQACVRSDFDALVTGPVSKAALTSDNLHFSGHTEFLANIADVSLPVMLLCAGQLRVALATTHLPLSAVPAAITVERLEAVLRILHQELRQRFDIADPHILVCGLNPHAGESGHLGREEIDTIIPVLEKLRLESMNLTGPLPADTLFLPQRLATADAVLAMYHDQGLPVLKYAGFGEAVNVTLGLPFVRTSVDHGTAFDIAGTGSADAGSLRAAINMAIDLCRTSRT